MQFKSEHSQWVDFLLAWESSGFVLFAPSVYWQRPFHVMKGNLLHSKFIDFNLIEKTTKPFTEITGVIFDQISGCCRAVNWHKMNHHATYVPTCAVEFVFLPDSRVMRYLGKVGEMDETCLPHREHSVTISHITVSPCHS